MLEQKYKILIKFKKKKKLKLRIEYFLLPLFSGLPQKCGRSFDDS